MAFTGYSNEGLSMLGKGIDSIGTAIDDYRTQQDVQQMLASLGQAQAGGMPQMPGAGSVQIGPLSPLGKQSDAAPIDLKSIPTFVQAAGQGTGIDPAYIARTFQVESGGNPNAVSPTGAKGLGQFTTGTWKTYGEGLGSPFDPNASAMATANLTADNADGLAQALGREPTQGETYLAHQQGLGGAKALLSNPGANVVDALASAYGGDRNKAARAVMVNGGRPDMTAGDFAAKWVSKFPSTPVRTALADAGANQTAPAAGQPMTLPAAAIAAPAGPDGAPAPIPSRGTQIASNDASFVPQAVPAGMQGDFAVRMPDGKLWTVAQAAASNDPNSPYDTDVQAAQEAARRGAALTGGQRPPGTQVAGPGAPMAISPPVQAQAVKADDSFVPGSEASPALSGGRQLLTAPVQFPQSRAAQLPPELAARLLTNPKTQGVAQSIISAQYGGKAGAWEIKELGNGQTVLFNPTQGVVPLGAAKATDLSHFKGPDDNEYAFDATTGRTTRLVAGGPAEGTTTDFNGRLVFRSKTGETRDVTPAGMPQGYRPATAEERASYGVPANTPLFFGPDGKPSTISGGGTTVNIDQKLAGKDAEALAAAKIADPVAAIEAAGPARKQLATLSTLADAWNTAGDNVTTGPAGEAVLKLKQFAKGSLGIDPAGLTQTELIQKVGTQLAAQASKELTSRPTQFDFKVFLDNNPSITLSPQGNKSLINLMQQKAKNDVLLAQVARQQKNGDNWDQVVADFDKAHPIISPLTGKPLDPNEVIYPGQPGQGGAGGASGQGSGNRGGQSQPQRRTSLAPGEVLSPSDVQQTLSNARAWVQANPGARAATIQRLQAAGIDPSGL